MNAEVKQLSAEWFAQRLGKITGSRVGAILGLNPYAKPESVLRDMVREYHGADPEFTGNADTERGQRHEKDAVEVLEIEEGVLIIEAPFVVHPTYDWLGASPDGYGSDGGLIECKCPRTIKSLDQVPHYVAQMQLQMHCTDTPHCWFVQWTADGSQIDKVMRDPHWIDDNLEALWAFHALYLETIASEALSKPHLEPLVKDMELDVEWVLMAEKLAEANAVMDAAKAEADKLKAWFIEYSEGQKSSGAGVTVYPTTRKTTDYKRLMKDYQVESVDAYQKETTSWSVRLNRN